LVRSVAILLILFSTAWLIARNVSWDGNRLHIQQPLAGEVATVFVVGDSGSGNENAFAVGQAMEGRCQKTGRPDALILLGDNAYPRGIQSIEDQKGIDTIMQSFQVECMKDVPIFAVLGNHDWKGNYRAQIQLQEKVKRWHMPARHYLVSFGSLLRIAMVDSNGYDGILNFPGSDMHSLQSNLLATKSQWTLMATHHPLRSALSARPREEDPIRTYVLQKRFCNRVDLWMSGHLHFMEHAPQDPECSSAQIVLGSGGGELLSVSRQHSNSPFGLSAFGFAEVRADAMQLKIEFIDSSQQSRHSFSIQRGGSN